MKKLLAFALTLIFIFSIARAQSIGDYKSGFKKTGNTISFSTTRGEVKFEFCTPEIFRIRSSWSGKFEANENLMVINYSLANVAVKVSDKKDHFLLATAKLVVKLYKAPFRIDVFVQKA